MSLLHVDSKLNWYLLDDLYNTHLVLLSTYLCSVRLGKIFIAPKLNIFLFFNYYILSKSCLFLIWSNSCLFLWTYFASNCSIWTNFVQDLFYYCTLHIQHCHLHNLSQFIPSYHQYKIFLYSLLFLCQLNIAEEPQHIFFYRNTKMSS